MDKWEKVKLSDICDIVGGGTPKTTIAEYWNGNIPWIAVVDFNNDNRRVLKTEKTISESGLANSSTKILDAGDIIISARGTVGALAQLGTPMAFNQSCYGLKAKPLTTSNFLYYVVKNSIDRIKKNTHGSVFDTITRSTFDEIKIYLPPLAEQRRIAAILSALDDKIELNNQINKNLEAQAQAIFKSWFVDFEPWGGVMLEDWQNNRMEKFFNISIGKTPPRKEPQWFTENDADLKWVSISDMGNCSVFISKSSEYLTRTAINKFNIKIVPDNTVLLSFKLTVGRVSITDGEMSTNEAIAHFNSMNSNIVEYLYFYLKNFDYQSLGNTSSIATAVNSKTIKAMPFIMPKDSIVTDFHRRVNPLICQIKYNLRQSQTLAAIRDSLLPKFMSGELTPPAYGDPLEEGV